MPSAFAADRRVKCGLDRPDPFPVHTLKRVNRPTTAIQDDAVVRVDERESGFNQAFRGDYGGFLKSERRRMVQKHPLSAALVNMQGMLSHLVGPGQSIPVKPAPENGPMPMMAPVADRKAPGTKDAAKMAAHIKETAYFLRADAVGICELPAYAVYSYTFFTGEPVELKHKYAIAVVVDQDWRTSSAFGGRDWISNAMSFRSYSASGFIACVLADYIRRLGYPARAHHARNYQVVVPPILLWAGLGEMSRIGDIVVNPFLGPRFKAAVVTTDMPLEVDKPIDFGLQDFCMKCKKCARECPSGAISDGGKVTYNGYEKWPVNARKCTSMRVGNQKGCGCGTCFKVCPWNKPFTPLHRMVNWTMRHISVARNLAIWGDDIFGYGKPDPAGKWWLDLEDVDGELQVPKNAVDDSAFLH
jgi:reductive dehalogenase